MKNRMKIIASLFCLLLCSCANPSITNVKVDALEMRKTASVYVARFEGNPDFVEEATDMFVLNLERKANRKIIQGDSIRTEGADVLRGGNIAEREAGLSQARKAGAGLLIVGKVTSHQTGGSLNGFVTVRVIDVETGNLVATIHRPSGLLIGHSVHQCVMNASKRVAESLAPAL